MGRPMNAKANFDEDDQYIEQARSPSGQGGASRIVSLHGDVNENMIANIIHHMLALAQINQDPIQMIISTYGGSADEMFGVYDLIKLLPAPVFTIALGKVMSAGVLLLAAGKKGQRVIGRSARIMMHPISGVAAGNIFQLENETEEMRRLQLQMVEAMVRETKMTKKVIEEIMKKGKDYYITPQKAIEYGIVDRVVGDMNE